MDTTINNGAGAGREITIVPPEERHNPGLVTLVAEINDIVQANKQFGLLKTQLLQPEDYQTYTQKIDGREETKRFIKKSGWRRIATAFSISTQPISSERIELEEGHFAIKYTVRATAPNGRYCDGVGSCDTKESRFQVGIWEGPKGNRQKVGTRTEYKFNDVDGTAYTRAANRAISDLVGGGEVSAEEIEAEKPQLTAPGATTAQLNDRYFDRLLTLARAPEFDNVLEHILANLLIAPVGHFLTQEQAIELGKTLAQYAQEIRENSPRPVLQPDPDPDPVDVDESQAEMSDPTDGWLAFLEEAVDLDDLAARRAEAEDALHDHPRFKEIETKWKTVRARLKLS